MLLQKECDKISSKKKTAGKGWLPLPRKDILTLRTDSVFLFNMVNLYYFDDQGNSKKSQSFLSLLKYQNLVQKFCSLSHPYLGKTKKSPFSQNYQRNKIRSLRDKRKNREAKIKSTNKFIKVLVLKG